MKRTLLSTLVLVAGSICSMAQNGLTVIENPAEDSYGAACISADGRYVAGSTVYGMLAFLYDTQTGTGTIFDAMDEDYGDMVLSVSNAGIGAGYGDVAYTFTMDGQLTAYPGFSILQGISSDGKFVVGNYKKSNTESGAAYYSWGKVVPLTEPTEDEVGFSMLGTYAKFVSADSSIICGNIVDKSALMPAVIWRRTDDGSYKLDAFCTKYSTQADSSNPYMVFSPTGLSDNGEWVALWITTRDELGAIGRYNTKTEELQVYVFDGSNEDFTTDPVTSGIANDGTLVGYTSYSDARLGFIWEAGKDEPQLLAKRFPLCIDFADYDAEGYHAPSAISADGRYIAGIAELDYEYRSYVLDTKAADEAYAAGIGATSIVPDGKSAAEVYSIDGRRLSAPEKGLNIIHNKVVLKK